ncbi:MAG: response regulator transcription factor [Bacteroidales bacterium]|nr:response regulator transcription factor [Bacteroidales bacterium]
MKVIVVEDEKMAAEGLIGLIRRVDPEMEVIAQPDSVKKAVEWFNNHPPPDLAFFDIQLADGLSFKIFEKTLVECPVIFTTAYHEYAIRAFKVNSIDYLLKPIDLQDLTNAINKFKKSYHDPKQKLQPEVFDKVLNLLTNNYKQRFVVKVGEHIRSIPVEDILYFYSQEKATFFHTVDNRNYVIDYSLEQVEELLDPQMFFRINRKYMITIRAIQDIITYSNSRLKTELKNSDDNDVIVAREKVKDFKKWLDR